MGQKRGCFIRRGVHFLTMALLFAGVMYPQTANAERVNIDELPMVSADGEYNYWKDIVIDENGEPVNLSPGALPSTGNPKIVVIMVDFPDVAGNEAITKTLVEDLFFGDKSLSSYYERASYGALNICGDVYGWYTAQNNREYYASHSNIQLLANEVLEALDDEIDFSQYDSNNDDYIDGLYICYAGEQGEWNSELWSYVAPTALKVDGKYLDRFAFINENHIYFSDESDKKTWTSIHTLAHETGHMLGLRDYYDAERGHGFTTIYSGATLMDDGCGELDAFSKYLLGWIKPVVITENGSATLKPSFTNASAVIIYPDETVRNENFLLVEYIPEEMSMGYDYTEGIRVYKINATSENGYLCYSNSLKRDSVDLIDIFSDFNTEPGTILYANQAPSSYFIKEDEEGNAVLEYTGISVDLVSYTKDEAEIRVFFAEADEVEVTHTETVLLNNNKLYIELEFSLETLPTESANAYVKLGNERKNVQITRYDDGVIIMGKLNNDEKVKYVLYSADFDLEPNTTYTVVVEAGAFLDPLGNTNEEFSFEVTTGDFAEVTALEDAVLYNAQLGMSSAELNSFFKGDYMPIDNNRVMRFYTYLNKLYVEIFEADGSREVKLLYTAETGVDLKHLYSVRMENGNSILRISTGSGSKFFLIDKEWDCRFLFTTQETLGNEIGVVYNTAYIAVLDEKFYYTKGNKLYLISEDGEVTEKILELQFRYNARAYELPEDKILFLSNDNMDFSVYDKNLNLVKKGRHSSDSKAEQEAVGLIYGSERIYGKRTIT